MSNNGKILAFPDRAALDAEAAAWVARFDAGDVSAKDQAAFQAWLNRSALHREAIAEYGSFWSEFDKLGHLANPVGAERAADTEARASLPLSGAKYWLAACAAAVLVMAPVGGVIRQNVLHSPSAKPATAPLVSMRQSYATAIGAQKTFTLVDGTAVTLNTNSRIDVEIRANRRDVHLIRGEAYFEVVHDKSRPFTVYANAWLACASQKAALR